MSHRAVGALVGTVFGLVFVLANTGSLATAPATVLRVLAVLAAVAVVLLLRTGRGGPQPERPGGTGFGRGYWLVVLAEVVALFAGINVLTRVLDAPQAGVAWVSTVVGVHFVALGRVWSEPFFARLGAALLLCGVAGLALAAAGSGDAAIDVVAGVLPGGLLLGAALLGAQRDGRTPVRA